MTAPTVIVIANGDSEMIWDRVAAGPIEIAALDAIRPGAEQFCFNATPWDAREIWVTADEWRQWFWLRTDPDFREQVARRHAGSHYDAYAVLWAFEQRSWEARNADIHDAVAFMGLGRLPVDIPVLGRRYDPAPYAVVFVHWDANPQQQIPFVYEATVDLVKMMAPF